MRVPGPFGAVYVHPCAVAASSVRREESGNNPEKIREFLMYRSVTPRRSNVVPEGTLQPQPSGACPRNGRPQLQGIMFSRYRNSPRRSTDLSGLFVALIEPIFGTCESCPQLTHLSSRGRRKITSAPASRLSSTHDFAERPTFPFASKTQIPQGRICSGNQFVARTLP